jgi:hypothetical protein
MKSFAAPALLLLAFGLPALAQDPPPAPSAPAGGGTLEAPPPPSSPVAGEPAEPEITIREGAHETIYEYRVHGRLYMIKIKPQVGPAYYMLDSNGDGVPDRRSNTPLDININQWEIFTWK